MTKTDQRLLFTLSCGTAMALIFARIASSVGGMMPAVYFAFGLLGLFYWQTKTKNKYVWIALGAGAPLLPAFHYDGAGKVIEALGKGTMDMQMIALEEKIFGWLFTGGQISYSIDQSSWLGPQTFLGKVFTEVMQLFYVSYYFMGPGLILLLVVRVWMEEKRAWNDLKQYLAGSGAALYLNFVGYVTVPIVGPQIAIADQYQNALTGFGLRPILHNILTSGQPMIQDCFPSGHTALGWLTALYISKLVPSIGRPCLIAAAGVTLATIVLRYHYILDLVAAVPLILLGLWVGRYQELEKRTT